MKHKLNKETARACRLSDPDRALSVDDIVEAIRDQHAEIGLRDEFDLSDQEAEALLTAYAKEVFLAGARFAGSKGALAEDSAHTHLLNYGLPAVTIEVDSD